MNRLVRAPYPSLSMTGYLHPTNFQDLIAHLIFKFISDSESHFPKLRVSREHPSRILGLSSCCIVADATFCFM